ncbi:hypothetical protein GN244_ATG10549 [Phytophthora infestans]|uniref:Uncharacterized protein n=1 Tax=Phytophthora infestans TaxID=4787 RepID=A0A833S8X3_PHYIN|nr:hypothetical protein GN244_ATG10549 [Phytophthora infestans]
MPSTARTRQILTATPTTRHRTSSRVLPPRTIRLKLPSRTPIRPIWKARPRLAVVDKQAGPADQNNEDQTIQQQTSSDGGADTNSETPEQTNNETETPNKTRHPPARLLFKAALELPTALCKHNMQRTCRTIRVK